MATATAVAPPLRPDASSVATARAGFAGGAGYLAACTMGLPMRATVAAVAADLSRASDGGACPIEYGAVVERTRGHYARLVSVPVDRVAIGSQTSVMISLIAAAVPHGAEILCVEGDFSSVVLPFALGRGSDIRVRLVPLASLADEIRADTWLVAYSLVQSATGEIADAAAISAAAARHGTFTLCDTTQAAGWMPVAAGEHDATVCHTYKWLCAPRGVAFLTLGSRLAAELHPTQAGWYAGEDPWRSCYGGAVDLAADARRFDVSPAWQAFVGAEPAMELFANLDPAALRDHCAGLAGAFRGRLGLEPGPGPGTSAIVTWNDPDGVDLERLRAAGIVASGRAGRARVAFHLFNDADDVDRSATALGR